MSRLLLLVAILPACTGESAIEVQKNPGGKNPDGTDTGDGDTDTGDGGTVSGSIEVAPSSIELPKIFVGQTASAELTVTNVGSGAVSVTVSLVGGWATDYTFDAYTSSPGAGEAAVHTLTITPTEWGDHSVSVLVDDAESGGHVEVPVTAHIQEDADGDGYGSSLSGGEDCDDANPLVNPGAAETWYDGVDGDCAGDDDFDQDGDGSRSPLGGGDDCDDTDPARAPGNEDAWYDGVDADCGGNDDYDQDADGYVSDDHEGLPTDGVVGSGDLPAGDCDDTDASVNPGARDFWYDGIDSDCAGNDDYDQDADGHLDASGGGDDCDDTDATVYPGAPDTWYDGVDSDCAGNDDYDQDGDGYQALAYGGDDCDDTDATVVGATDETLDGVDNDCNGTIDDVAADSVASGYLLGYSSSMQVGNHGLLAMGADVNGDGAKDLVLGAINSGSGYVWAVDGATAASAAGSIADYEFVTLSGDSSSYPVGWVNGPMADVDADGTADLAFGGGETGSSGYYGRSYLFAGGTDLAGPLSSSDFDTRFDANDDSSYSDEGFMVAEADLDGDGYAEVIVGAARDNDGDSDRDAGSVIVYSGATMATGNVTSDDADDVIYGVDGSDYLGQGLTTADMDADGLADVVATAPGYDEGGNDAGGVFIFAGDSLLVWAAEADDAALVEIRGTDRNANWGEDTVAHPGDVDGDGALDLGMTQEDDGEVWIFLAAGSAGSPLEDDDADHILSGNPGDAGSMLILDSDLDGDGADEIVIGADGDDTAGSNAGLVWVFSWSSSWAQPFSDADARATILGPAAGGYFGSGGAGGADLDGDGLEDVALGEVTADDGASDAGAVWIVKGW
jgi:hypothetical protein